jgi:hypothetical protein
MVDFLITDFCNVLQCFAIDDSELVHVQAHEPAEQPVMAPSERKGWAATYTRRTKSNVRIL